MRIQFGTSGWRGIIARDFTWDRVDSVVDAIASHLGSLGFDSVAVGGDTRFQSPELAERAARRFAGYGFRAVLSDRPVPTPVLSHAVRRLALGGVVNFTASHNPFMYNGIKFSPSSGGPAGGDVTSAIEKLIEEQSRPAAGQGGVEVADLIAPYVADLPRFLDVDCFRDHTLRAVFDPFNGTSSGLLDRVLRGWGASVRTIHEKRDPLFDGRHPEPNEKGLEDLSSEVVRSGASIGLANDGDADRFGLVDESGIYVSPHDFLALLLDYLVSEKGVRGAAVRSVSTGSLMDRVASSAGLELIETRVGFKYLGACMLERQVSLAGEESGGLSVGGHVPEKDGILACLYAAEMVCKRKAGLGLQLRALWERYGRLFHRRLDLALDDPTRAALEAAFAEGAMKSIGGIPVVGRDTVDGARLRLEGGGWVLMRMSGTEPLARVYLEASSAGELDALEAGVGSLLPGAGRR
jgi:phosphomannomutase